ncbi:ABC transporter permease [Arenibaculum pallidiluteum]|uniref:ABC transporter permease n=1 Tax=Arenibaculum pallidiluteum TaxID=2812559 RepID=UPI001A95A77C|nr:ABC transporter permease [Arenibaculum pallidiluteum]
MQTYILKRILGMAVVMLIVATISFVIVRVVPGDPAAIMLGPDASPADIADLRARLGLERPLPAQYAIFMGDLLTGDLGRSIFLDRPVVQALAERAEPTICLTVMATLVALLIGIPAGIVSAVRRGSAVDQATLGLAMLGASIPSFWLGLLFIQFFAVRLGWFPVAGYGDPGAGFLERLRHLVLPALVLGLLSSALITRFTRASMLDVLGDDYVRTGRAKGLDEWTVIMKHAFRNALIPVLTVIGLTVAVLLGGAIVTETVFGLPGVGNLVVQAVLRRDYPVIQGTLIVVAAVYVLVNLTIDLLYTVVDPRVRY